MLPRAVAGGRLGPTLATQRCRRRATYHLRADPSREHLRTGAPYDGYLPARRLHALLANFPQVRPRRRQPRLHPASEARSYRELLLASEQDAMDEEGDEDDDNITSMYEPDFAALQEAVEAVEAGETW